MVPTFPPCQSTWWQQHHKYFILPVYYQSTVYAFRCLNSLISMSSLPPPHNLSNSGLPRGLVSTIEAFQLKTVKSYLQKGGKKEQGHNEREALQESHMSITYAPYTRQSLQLVINMLKLKKKKICTDIHLSIKHVSLLWSSELEHTAQGGAGTPALPLQCTLLGFVVGGNRVA